MAEYPSGCGMIVDMLLHWKWIAATFKRFVVRWTFIARLKAPRFNTNLLDSLNISE